LLAATALALVSSSQTGCERARTSPGAQASHEAPPTKVKVVVSRKMNVPIIGRPNGTTRALSDVTIRARVKGFLKEKEFDEGSNVKKDKLLLVIDEEPFKVKVDQAKAILDEALAGLKKAEQSKAREIAKAQMALEGTQLQLDRVEERRERNLLARKATSQDDYDRAKAKADKSVAAVEAAKANLEQAVADYDVNILSARAEVEKARADLESARIELGYCRMSSPIDGRAGELQVKLGNLVGPAAGSSDTTSLLTIQQLDPMGVDIRPASRYLPLITKLVRAGLEVKLSVQGKQPHPYTGKVVFVDNTVDPTTSTVLVKAQVPNPDHTLLPGEYVIVQLNVGDYAGVVVVPERAVVESQEGSRVLTVDPENKVEVALVKVLDSYQGLLALESGLAEGQRVLMEGLQLVRPGQSVAPEEVELKADARAEFMDETPDPLASPFVRIRGAGTETQGTRPAPNSEPSPPSQGPPTSRPSAAPEKGTAPDAKPGG
jgi:RND family efflux transporter MFP subunit